VNHSSLEVDVIRPPTTRPVAISATTPERGRPATLGVETTATATVLRLAGELDLLTVPGLQTRLTDVVAATTGVVVVDLTAVQFLSSSGLHLLLTLRSELAPRGRPLRLVVGASRAVVRPLLITGLDRLLELHPDLDTALAAVPEAGG
jgi:anti-sigma B factor antagonist